MNTERTKKKPFPKRESIPGTHQPDSDGRTDYGRDGETTYSDNLKKEDI